MKATMGITYNIMQTEINNINQRLLDLRQESVTGKKINKPSDDPAAIRPILHFRREINANEQFQKNLSIAQNRMQLLDSHLGQIEDLLLRGKELAIQAVNANMSKGDREILADQVARLRQDLLQTANSKSNGVYVFAGFKEDTQPFEVNQAYDPAAYDPANNTTWPINYRGDSNAKSLEIAPGEMVQTSLTGSELFLGDADNNGEVDTGKVDIFAALTNLEDALRSPRTKYRSEEQYTDEVLDSGTGDFQEGTLTLQVGQSTYDVDVTYAATDSNSNGNISLEEIAQQITSDVGPINASVQQDADGYNRLVLEPSSSDMVSIESVQGNLAQGNFTLDNGLLNRIEYQMENLGRAEDQVISLRGQMGVRSTQVENNLEQMKDASDDMREVLSRYEDADIFETFSSMISQEHALKAALMVTSRVSRLSILNYM